MPHEGGLVRPNHVRVLTVSNKHKEIKLDILKW
jgi:hypothetical protein